MDAFIGEIRAFPYTYTPRGWLSCNGLLYPINQFTALYAILTNHYGGDGKTSFAVPNLNGRAVVGCMSGNTVPSANFDLAETLGTPSVTLNLSQIPAHSHGMVSEGSTTRLTAPSPNAVPLNPLYKPVGATRYYNLGMYVSATLNPTVGTMASMAIASAGSGAAHENRSPLLIMHYCICYDGEWPSRN